VREDLFVSFPKLFILGRKNALHQFEGLFLYRRVRGPCLYSRHILPLSPQRLAGDAAVRLFILSMEKGSECEEEKRRGGPEAHHAVILPPRSALVNGPFCR
jgi:hypothetical protein